MTTNTTNLLTEAKEFKNGKRFLGKSDNVGVPIYVSEFLDRVIAHLEQSQPIPARRFQVGDEVRWSDGGKSPMNVTEIGSGDREGQIRVNGVNTWMAQEDFELITPAAPKESSIDDQVALIKSYVKPAKEQAKAEQPFHVGQKVVCVDDEICQAAIQSGREYEISDARYLYGRDEVKIVGDALWFRASRFRPAPAEQPENHGQTLVDALNADAHPKVLHGALVAALIAEGNSIKESRMTGAELIAVERQRQITSEGWTPEHDDEHADGSLLTAAIVLADDVSGIVERWIESPGDANIDRWPWKLPARDKYDDNPIRLLSIAGALLAAEIDRLQRLETKAVSELTEQPEQPEQVPSGEKCPYCGSDLDQQFNCMDQCVELPAAVPELVPWESLAELLAGVGGDISKVWFGQDGCCWMQISHIDTSYHGRVGIEEQEPKPEDLCENGWMWTLNPFDAEEHVVSHRCGKRKAGAT